MNVSDEDEGFIIGIDEIEAFSSRGPTLRGLIKPDMVAPNRVTTSLTAGSTGGPENVVLNPFTGTSAAAPHVAGAAALLLSEESSRTARVLAETLAQLAIDLGPVGKDNTFGHGRLRLRVNTDTTPPTIAINFPRSGDTITMISPRVVAELTDSGSGINANTIEAWLDNEQVVENGELLPHPNVSDFSFDADTGRLLIQLVNLTRTRHSVYLRVADNSGNVSEIVATSFRVASPAIDPGLHIISLPYPDLANRDPSIVFGVTESQLALVRWVPTDSRVSKYHAYPDEFASFSPPDQLVAQPPVGLGYFISLPSIATLNVTGEAYNDRNYEIKLVYGNDPPRGWNLIGNPFDEFVDWGSVEFVSANGRQDLREAMDSSVHSPVTEGVLFEFVSTAGGGFYSFSPDPTQATMEPMKGYWLHVLKEATLIVHNPTGGVGALANTPRQESSSARDNGWLLQLQAHAGKYQDPVNFIGVSSAATDGYDPGIDVSAPPPLVDVLNMYFPKNDWGHRSGNFVKDVRSDAAQRHVWDVEVACKLTNVPVTISWPEINQTVPGDVALRLEDLDSGNSVYMRTANGYTFTMSSPGIRNLRIHAVTGNEPGLSVTGVQSAAARGGNTMLTYSVTRTAEVSVEVRNISGVMIKNFAATTAEPGKTQTLLWNGRTNRGVAAPAGRYFARITARATDGQTVQAITPFELVR